MKAVQKVNSEGDFALTPSEPKKQDGRHRRFMELIFKAHEHYVKVPPNFGSAAGNNLRRLLKGDPRLDEKRFIKMLRHYHQSEDHARANSPAYYIPTLPKYELGPLNKWGREEETMGIGQ